MRTINYIVVHCTATPVDTTLESVLSYWKNIRKWGDTPGYHYLILRSGFVKKLMDENKETFGSFGHNPECIHIAYMGGIDPKGNPVDNRTDFQKQSMYEKLLELSVRYPKAKIIGHRDFSGVKKACPSFDVKTWLASYTPPFLTDETEPQE